MNRFLTFISALALTGMIQAGAYEIYYDDLGSGYSFILETETRTAQMNSYLNESNFSGGALVIPEKINFSSENYDESVWGEYAIAGELSIYWSDDKVKQSLTSVKIPEGITSISGDTFYNCTNLETIEFPSTLTSIGVEAFNGCTALKSVEFPKSLVSIGNSAFGSTALENITFNYSSVDKFLTSSVEGFPYGCFGGDGSTNIKEIRVTNLINGQPMKNVLIPMGMETIKDYAFWNDVNVESVTFPDGFKSIPAGAFRRTAIKALKMPASLETIGDRAFEGCDMLEEITFNEGLKTIGERAFQRCTAIAGIVLPNSVTEAGISAFAQCEDLESVVLLLFPFI